MKINKSYSKINIKNKQIIGIRKVIEIMMSIKMFCIVILLNDPGLTNESCK